MIRRAALVVAAIVALAACGQSSTDQTERGANGAITAPGLLGVEHLREGDCIRDRVPDVVEGIVGVPCARPHHAQVIAIGTTDTIELTGVRFTAGITFDFTNSNVTQLAPGGRVVVVKDLAAFMERYPAVPLAVVAGEFTGNLENAGERITLLDPSDAE